jgi:hypothetical protein
MIPPLVNRLTRPHVSEKARPPDRSLPFRAESGDACGSKGRGRRVAALRRCEGRYSSRICSRGSCRVACALFERVAIASVQRIRIFRDTLRGRAASAVSVRVGQ